MTIDVVSNGKRKSFLEWEEQEWKIRARDRQSIRRVLFAVRIIRANFPQKVTLE